MVFIRENRSLRNDIDFELCEEALERYQNRRSTTGRSRGVSFADKSFIFQLSNSFRYISREGKSRSSADQLTLVTICRSAACARDVMLKRRRAFVDTDN